MPTIELDVEIPDLAEVEIETPDTEITPSGGDTVVVVATPGPPGIAGPPGEGEPIFGETPAGTINGTNVVFTAAAEFRPNSTAVYVNGLREHHYSESSSTTITLEDAPVTGDDIRIDYILG
jgi:hypothetical protein